MDKKGVIILKLDMDFFELKPHSNRAIQHHQSAGICATINCYLDVGYNIIVHTTVGTIGRNLQKIFLCNVIRILEEKYQVQYQRYQELHHPERQIKILTTQFKFREFYEPLGFEIYQIDDRTFIEIRINIERFLENCQRNNFMRNEYIRLE